MGRNTEEWPGSSEKELRLGLSRIHKTKDQAVIEEKFQELKKKFPKSEPYVLTHGDLNSSNIIVKDNKIEAIIDWEVSAYLPCWAER
jgi:aminoglycoside phosphotransferase (APT) family kinase protein